MSDTAPEDMVLVGDTWETPEDAAEYARAEREAIGPSDSEIRDPAAEAGAAGDAEQVALCELALAGDDGARDECERVIRAAAARASDGYEASTKEATA